MGKLDGKFLRGSINNLVYRKYRDLQVVQSKPHTPKRSRTVGTVKAAMAFGKASKLAWGVRLGLGSISAKFYDGTMNYRLNAEILRALNNVKNPETQTFDYKSDSFTHLAGFEFNAMSPLKNQLLLRPNISLGGTSLKVIIPEIKVPTDVKFPKNSSGCKLLVVTAIIDIVNSRAEFATPQMMDIPFSYKPTVVPETQFDFEIIPGCLCITAISLQYVESSFIGEVIVNNKSFNPSAILHAFVADGTADPAASKDWMPIDSQ